MEQDRSPVGRLTALAVVVTAVVVAVFGSMLVRGRPLDAYYGLFLFQNGPPSVLLVWLGYLVLRRHPGHGAGLVLVVIALVGATHTAVAAVADTRLVAAGFVDAPIGQVDLAPADLPLDAAVPFWLMNWLWVPAPVLAIVLLPLVFPDGALPSARWRTVVRVAAGGAGLLMTAFMIDAWPTVHWTAEDAPLVPSLMIILGGLAVLASSVASMFALAMRWRAADAQRRRQFRPVGVCAGLFGLVVVATYPWQEVWVPAILVGFNALLVAYALSVARYRLHDLEPVLGRAAVAALVSLLVAAVYAVVIVGVGAFVEQGAENSVLPLVAVAMVALLIEPARRGARRLVDRLLYRAVTNRIEVLSQLAARASKSDGAEDVLAEVTGLLLRSTGASRAEAWLETDTTPRLAAAAGTTDEPAPTLRADVGHQARRLGELRLYARAQADLVPDAAQLLGDVAGALGVVLRNDQLTAQLQAQVVELAASRQRLVEVHDHTRRNLERDIHDGAQARLIALRLRLGALRARVDVGQPDPGLAEELDALAADLDGAVRALRDLARGLHPPILEQSGLSAALRAHGRDLPVPVSVTPDAVGRYPRAAETAVYFACLEAIQNAVRHGDADAITVELTGEPDGLRFCVLDDGVGFDPARVEPGAGLTNISDRAAALGGWTRIESRIGRGTRVSGEIPVPPIQPPADDR